MINNKFGWYKTDEKTKELESQLKDFEIHITTNKLGIEYFKKYNIAYLEIDMLDKDLNFIQKDYMCALKMKFNNFEECKEYTLMTAHSMVNHFDNEIEIYRVKIESPPLNEYFNNALYIERHWTVENYKDSWKHPLSFIINKNKYVATERTYDKNEFKQFSKNYPKTELCLFDNNVIHDKEWFKLYE